MRMSTPHCNGMKLLVALAQVLMGVQLVASVPTTTRYLADSSRNRSDPLANLLEGSAATPPPTEYPQYEAMTPTWMKCAKLTGVSQRLEALPGTGWDSLANKDMGWVMAMTYDKCQITPDGKYLIPDNIVTVPLKKSQVKQYSDVYTDFTDYKDTTSQSMHLDASYGPVSGSFSEDFQENKENQVLSKSATTRAEIRHQHYLVEVNPDATLAPALVERLTEIGDLINSNNSKAADYESELLILDYGTHMVRSVVAGGVFVQESQVKSGYVDSMQSSSTSMKAAASASFMVTIGFQFSYGTSTQSIQDFQNNVTQSTTRTYGGPAYMPGLLVNTWEQGLDNALVATDRQGDPIEFMITKYALPQMPEPTVRQVANKVSVASKKYLKYNTHQGCTDLTSPSFDYKANSGDTSLCSLAPNNYTFGGVFQNCSSPQDYGRDICAGLRQKNPLSGTYGCPSGYDAVKLNTGSETFNWNDHECHTEYHHCGFLWLQKCGRQVCSTQYLGAVANYETYWCVKLGPVEPKSGYLFGGIYSASSSNLVTGTHSCPKFFYPLSMGSGMKVCVSDNYEQGIASSVPFAGFFSCHIGNPLSLISTPAAEKAGISAVGYGLLIGEESWPHHCPHGYAQHLASIDESCAVEYCVKSHAFDRPSRLLLKRPPYGKAYPMPQNNTVELNFITGPSGKTWSRNGTAGSWKRNFRGLELEAIQQPSSSLQTPSHHTDTQMVAGVSVASVFACALLIALVVTCRKNQRLQRRGFQPPLISGETASTSTGYTSVNTTPAPDAISSESARQRTGYSTLG